MPIQVKEENGGKMFTIHVNGKLQKKDCEDLNLLLVEELRS